MVTTATDCFAVKVVEAAGAGFLETGVSLFTLHARGRMTAADVTLEQNLVAVGAVRDAAPNTFLMCPIPVGKWPQMKDTPRASPAAEHVH